MAVAALPDTLIDELVAICGEEHVLTGKSALFNRARVPALFPAHRWEDYIPQVVVLPMAAGTDHVAFAHADLGDLLYTYVRLKKVGVVATTRPLIAVKLSDR